MRQKELRLVVAFHTTDCAMATEKRCRAAGLAGKLITVPRSITSDCGLAWSAPPEVREPLEELLRTAQIETSGMYELLL